MPAYSSVAIVGVGLIGGSIGLALRERRLAGEVVGIGRREVSLRQAQARGAVDRFTTDLAAGVADSEVIVVCSPVALIADHILAARAACPANALITDAGSIKAAIVTAVESAAAARRTGSGNPVGGGAGQCLPSDQQYRDRLGQPMFVGSHPLAGDHRTGVAHARANLFTGRTVVVTPTDTTPPMAVERASALWRALGADVVALDPDEHDRLLAATSHMPHLMAAAVVAATPTEGLPLTATGWQDVTRIAASDPGLWQTIITMNRQHILRALDRVEKNLAEIRSMIATADDRQLLDWLSAAKRIRERAED